MSWDKRAMRDAVVRNKSFEGFERGRRETSSTGREGPGLREQPQIPMYAQSWDVRWPAMYDERWRMEEVGSRETWFETGWIRWSRFPSKCG